MLDNLRIFITAADQLSLTSAAAELGMTIATVSRRVQELEQQLQCELFHRSNRGLTLTPYGQAYYAETADFIRKLELRLLNLDKSLNSLEGELRVMAPTNIGSGPLDAFWCAFVANNRRISLNVLLGDPDDDVIANQVDIAIRSGPQQNSSLIQQKIGTITPVLVASPSFAQPLPTDLDDVMSLPSIAAPLFSEWRLRNGDEEHWLAKKHTHISNDMAVALNLVKAGAGIALLPLSMVSAEINNGNVIQIVPQWHGVPREISLLWPKKRTLSARARKFRDELIEFLRSQDWFTMAR